ncbi:uncharacterized protein LOC115883816 [Sitophilus oryzae]|uniref:Uncharacterized protein LOC115883816 n=1 Tax=Sitophilus oryzae TaxID=7048 RepID=A0A6J2Y2M5_SITOR|nr:uncharacterized protein LOC115883816 [Sitophilus oryzae]
MAIQNVDDLGTKRACSVTDSVLKSEVSNASLNKYAGNQNKKAKGQRKDVKNVRKNPSGGDNRYSMYTATASFRRDAYFRKTVENLAKKKFNVKSKYKTATYKHRPPLQKEPDILTFPRLKLLGAKKSGTRLNSPLNEDAIETMVENDDGEPDSAGNKDTEEKNQLQVSL